MLERSASLPTAMQILRGLSHSDAEVVIWFSSAYKGTPEGQSAAKKHTYKNGI